MAHCTTEGHASSGGLDGGESVGTTFDSGTQNSGHKSNPGPLDVKLDGESRHFGRVDPLQSDGEYTSSDLTEKLPAPGDLALVESDQNAIPVDLSDEVDRLLLKWSVDPPKRFHIRDHLNLLSDGRADPRDLAVDRERFASALSASPSLECLDFCSCSYDVCSRALAMLLPLLVSSSSVRRLDFQIEILASSIASGALVDFVSKSKSLEEVKINSSLPQDLSEVVALDEARVALSVFGRALSRNVSNDRTPLVSLRISIKRHVLEEGARHMAAALTALPNLDTLNVVSNNGMDESTARLLGEAVAFCPALNELRILYKSNPDDALAIFAETAFPRISTHLKDVFVSFWERISDTCDYDIEHRTRCRQRFFASLKQVKNLQVFTFFAGLWAETLVELQGFANADSTLQEIKLSFKDQAYSPADSSFFASLSSFLNSLEKNTSIKAVCLNICAHNPIPPEIFQDLADLIAADTPLENLELGWCSEGDCDWITLFGGLRNNFHLKRLVLSDSTGIDEPEFRELAEALRVNFTLQKVDLVPAVYQDAWDGKSEILEDALQQKARRESFRAVLWECLPQSSKFTLPTAARFFFCGPPNAGKTQLCTSMLAAIRGKPGWIHTPQRTVKGVSKSTEGLEIMAIKNTDDLQLSLWDLGGNQIFRALQEFVLPRFNRTCIFAFVFSAFEDNQRMSGIEEAFEKEFRSWLCFLSSNLKPLGRNRPQVVVIFTHVDKVGAQIYDRLENPITEKLREEFTGVLDIFSRVFRIDATKEGDALAVLSWAEPALEYLQRTAVKIPELCNRVNRVVTDWMCDNSKEPVIDFEKFSSLCGKAHPQLENFQGREEDKDKVLRAIAAYLHDVGVVVELTEHDTGRHRDRLIVVNPSWLTGDFVGRLLGMANEFQQSEKDKMDFRSRLRQWSTANGYVTQTQLNDLLRDRFVEPLEEKKYVRLGLDYLRRVLEGLDMCPEVSESDGTESECSSRPTDVTRLFLPTLFENSADGPPELKWSSNVSPQDCFFGVRIRRADRERTRLSHAFFLRFQVHLCTTLKSKLSLAPHQFVCDPNLISLTVQGHDIRVENDTSDGSGGDHIDVLVRSSQSNRIAWGFATDHVVEEARGFCASSRGCPGVELLLEIIRPECVENLTPARYRAYDQAVSSEVLKDILREVVFSDAIDGDQLTHNWPSVEDARSGSAPVLRAQKTRAIQLVSPFDMDDLEEWIRAYRPHFWKGHEFGSWWEIHRR